MGVPTNSGGYSPFGALASTAPTSGGSGGKRTIVGYANGQPIYSDTAMNGVDTSGMGTKAQQAAAGNNAGRTAYNTGNEVAAKTSPMNMGAPGNIYTLPSTPQATPTYGTQSGPGLMEQWFGERASGTDPAYEYATKRGLTALDNGYAARGMYNSGASTQGDRDFVANLESQREGQLDQLAGAADSSYNTRLATMLGLGSELAGGEAGLAGMYDTGAANAMTGATSQALNLGTQAAMIPYLANQGLMNNLFGGITTLAGAAL